MLISVVSLREVEVVERRTNVESTSADFCVLVCDWDDRFSVVC